MLLFITSLFTVTVMIGDDKPLTGIETFFFTIRHATAGLFGEGSNKIVSFIALLAVAANFVFIFWAMLVFAPTRITSLRGFWWVSILFMIAASYTGFQAMMRQGVNLAPGYFIWISALVLMLLAPVISRIERKWRHVRVKSQPH